MSEPQLVKPNEGNWSSIGTFKVLFRTDPKVTGDRLDYIEMFVPPGDGVPLHIHHKNDETVHVIKGDFTFELDGEESPAPPGTFMYIPQGVTHKFTNVGTEDGYLIATITGAGYYELFESLVNAEKNNLDEADVEVIRKKWGLENLEGGGY